MQIRRLVASDPLKRLCLQTSEHEGDTLPGRRVVHGAQHDPPDDTGD